MKKIIYVCFMALLLSACNSGTTQVKRPVVELDEYLRVDGSTVTIPFSEALCAKLTDSSLEACRTKILHNKTHQAYINLIEGKTDLIFVTGPSADELAYARVKDVEMIVVPFTSEGFVFLTDADNPVDDLALEQIQRIYTGEIKNWNEVGGNDVPIHAYQRPVNSGSQTGFLELVMKDLTPMAAPTEMMPAGMGELIEVLATYKNEESAIGYSYYYYVTDMWKNDDVKLLKVDDVYPDKTTIASKTYSLTTNYFMVFRNDEKAKSEVRKVVAWIDSPDGQQLVEDAGYVKVR